MGHRLLLLAFVVSILSPPGLVQASPRASVLCLVGRQKDGAVVLPTNQVITPAGRQIEFEGRPNAVALRPDGRTATFLTATATAALTVVDLRTARVIQTFAVDGDDGKGDGASFAGLVYASDGGTLYASDARGAITVAAADPNGRLGGARRIALPDDTGTARPAGLALAPDGRHLYVALNRRNTLGVIDLVAGRMVSEIAVGNGPHHVALVSDRVYVSNEGGRRPRP